MASKESLQLAASAWCHPTTSHLVMIPALAMVFAEILDKEKAATEASAECHEGVSD